MALPTDSQNEKSFSDAYKAAGVDITAGYKAVELMKEHVKRTAIPGVLGGLGGFGGLFAPDLTGYSKPVLISGADGVGTKLKIAFEMDKHDTIGIDCVAMCVNDIVCAGAKPLFFLDYLASSRTVPERVEQIVKGISDGCVAAGCALVGGETAEMPGFYADDEYDIAGFCVGLVDMDKMIDGKKNIAAGDVLVGLDSSGLHSNAFSLVRRVFNVDSSSLGRHIDELGQTLGECLLTPTVIYVKAVLDIIASASVHGVCNITGGGFYENIPRMLPDCCDAVIDKGCLNPLPIFRLIQSTANITEHDMFNTFNMGTGMVIALRPGDADAALAAAAANGCPGRVIGEVAAGTGGVILK